MTSDEVLDLDYVPGRVAVIGGGAIGCEFASTFADLGSQVTILEGLPKILPGLDADVANVVVRSFKKKKIDIRTGVKVNGHTPERRGRHDGALRRRASRARGRRRRRVGRPPAVRRPARARRHRRSRSTERGFVEVDEFCRTGEPGVYAIGDLINTPQLAHVGYAEAILVVKHILGESPMPVDVRPCAVGDLLPSRGRVGRSRRGGGQGGRLRRRRRQAPVPCNSRAQILGETDGLVKIIAKKQPDGTAGQVLGVHMVGPWVTEQLERRLPRRQLGGDRRRGRRVHPAPPEPDRAVR